MSEAPEAKRPLPPPPPPSPAGGDGDGEDITPPSKRTRLSVAIVRRGDDEDPDDEDAEEDEEDEDEDEEDDEEDDVARWQPATPKAPATRRGAAGLPGATAVAGATAAEALLDPSQLLWSKMRLPPPADHELEFLLSEPSSYRVGKSTYSHIATMPGGSFRFRLLIFPAGTSASPRPDQLAAFVEAVPPDEFKDARWAFEGVRYQISVVNWRDYRRTVTQNDTFTFQRDNVDRGWHKGFLKVSDMTYESGWLNKEGQLCLRASCSAPRATVVLGAGLGGVGRRIAGYVGLKNHGATCYMNCLLQTLFHIGRFRHVVYSIDCPESAEQAALPSDDADSPGNLGLGSGDDRPALPLLVALQNLFYRLQTSEAPVSCRELMRSFGWDTSDAFMQHDAQELNRLLCDRLEEQMKGTPMDGEIKRLFEGEMENYIECCDIEYRSQRNETFYDLQLNVKNDAGKELLSLEESLRDFTSEETLEGDNAYDAEGHGKQRARKGCRFKRFPPVLYIQLKRFNFDPERMDMCKLNNRMEFPQVLDLEAFAPGSGKYLLHTVVVHSGGVSSGHYYAFARTLVPGETSAGGRWVKFDDEQVSLCSPQAAVEENYGGEDPMIWEYFNLAPHEIAAARPPTTKRVHNAYMLSYVKADMFEDTISAPILDVKEKTYRELIERCEREARLNEERKKAKMEQLSTVEVQLLLERDLTRLEGFWSHHELPCTHRFRMPRERTGEDLWRKAEDLLGIPYANMALFLLQLRKTDQTRFKIMPPQKVLSQLPTCGGPPHSPGHLVVLCVVSRGYCPQTLEWKGSAPTEEVPHEIFKWTEELCLLIVKYFCPTTQRLVTLGCYYTHQLEPIDVMVSEGWLADRLQRFVETKEVAPLSECTPLMCWEEFNHRSPKEVVHRNHKESIEKEGLYLGDIIIWQPVPPQVEATGGLNGREFEGPRRPEEDSMEVDGGADDEFGPMQEDDGDLPALTVKDLAVQMASRLSVHVRLHRAEAAWSPEGIAADGALGRTSCAALAAAGSPSPGREDASDSGMGQPPGSPKVKGGEGDCWREITADIRWRVATLVSRATKAFGLEEALEEGAALWLFERGPPASVDDPPCFRTEAPGARGRSRPLCELMPRFGTFRIEMHLVLVPKPPPQLEVGPMEALAASPGRPSRRPVAVHFFDASVREVGATVLHVRDMTGEDGGSADLGLPEDSDSQEDAETGRPPIEPSEVLRLARQHLEQPGNSELLAKLRAAARAEGFDDAPEGAPPRQAPPLRLLDTSGGRIRRVYRETQPASTQSGEGDDAGDDDGERPQPPRKRPRLSSSVWPAQGSNFFFAALRVELDLDSRPPVKAEAEDAAAQLIEVIQAETSGRVFGHPFLLRASCGASGSDLRSKMQAKLGLPDGELSLWRLKVVAADELRHDSARDEQPIGERLRDADHFPSRSGCEAADAAGGMLAWSPSACRLCIERPHPARTARSPAANRGLRIQKPLAIRAQTVANGDAVQGETAERQVH